MVKKLKYEDFLSELDKLYTASKEKHSVYLTFKRLYQENFKYKRNAKNRKLRMEDRKMQDKSTERFNVLVRAKLQKKEFIQQYNAFYNLQISPDEIGTFHHILTNVLTLHFIRDEVVKKEKKQAMKKTLSKTQKRKIKKLKKIKAKEGNNDNTMVIDK